MKQRTLAQSITAAGIGLHSGQKVLLELCPQPVNSGIVFERTDLDGARIPLDAFLVQDTMMSSNLVQGQVRIGTVEHLLSAVAAMGIDNLLIKVSAAEIPIMDGSAAPFLYLLTQAGICKQEESKRFLKIKKKVKVHSEDKWASLEPYDEGFLLNFEIDFAHPAIKNTGQTASFQLSTATFANEVAMARTFGFLKDLQQMHAHNLALGGSMENAIVLDEDSVLNEGGLRLSDEFVRHKLLDAVGDLYLIGYPLLANFSAYKSGHALNNQLIRSVLSDSESFEIVTFDDTKQCPISYFESTN